MSRHLDFPRPLACGHDYWLCRCEGFGVDAPTGPVGLVEAVRFGARLDRPDELLVRRGVLGNRRLVVAVSDVQQVIPQQRIVLLSAQGERRHDRLALCAHLRRNRAGGGRTASG